MRKVITAAFVSLDGVMQAPGGPDEDPTGGFRFGGWLAPCWDDVTGQAMDETFAQPFDLLLGRKTYDIFAAYWPYVQLDRAAPDFDAGMAGIAEAFGRAKKHVATHSKPVLSWKNSERLGDDAVAGVRRLKQGEGPVLLTQGSADFLQSLLATDLIDELRLLIFPLVLGKGKRLFGPGTQPAAFRQTRSTTSPQGVVIATYERAGDVQTGSFASPEPSEAELVRRRNLR